MSKMIFVNLPVRDVEKAKAFYVALGYDINPQFTDENAACVVASEAIHFMLLKREFFQGFTDKAICDTATHLETLLALSADSRAEVDAMLGKAIGAGGREAGSPRDYGFMYQRSFTDLDGHTFEIAYMNMAEFPGAGGAG